MYKNIEDTNEITKNNVIDDDNLKICNDYDKSLIYSDKEYCDYDKTQVVFIDDDYDYSWINKVQSYDNSFEYFRDIEKYIKNEAVVGSDFCEVEADYRKEGVAGYWVVCDKLNENMLFMMFLNLFMQLSLILKLKWLFHHINIIYLRH